MLKDKIKILFFHFDLGDGGAERVLVNLLNNLDQEKYDITLKTIFSGDVNRRNLKSHIKFKPLFKRKAFRGMTQILKIFPAKFLNKIFIREFYDVQIAFIEGLPTRIIGAIKPLNGQTKYAWLHISANSNKIFLTAFRSKQEFINIYNNFTKLAFVSRKALLDFERFYSVKTPKHVVHNVNDFAKIETLAKEEINIQLSSKLNFCYVGRLSDQKRIDRLIEAFHIISSKGFINWHLYIIGKGDLEQSLKNLSNSYHLEDQVSFLGFQSNPYAFISKMDFFVCPSEREGYSTAVTEASFLGIPVLTTDCGGMDEIIANGETGYIVENSTKGLVDGLEKILNSDSKKLNALKDNILLRREFFSVETAVDEFENFIKK